MGKKEKHSIYHRYTSQSHAIRRDNTLNLNFQSLKMIYFYFEKYKFVSPMEFIKII